MADDRTVLDDERDDIDDLTPAGILKRLDRVTKILTRANARLDRIQAGWQNPPEPDRPATITAVTNVQNQAQHALDVANDLLARLRG